MQLEPTTGSPSPSDAPPTVSGQGAAPPSSSALPAPAKKGRGRPKGSKSKTKPPKKNAPKKSPPRKVVDADPFAAPPRDVVEKPAEPPPPPAAPAPAPAGAPASASTTPTTPAAVTSTAPGADAKKEEKKEEKKPLGEDDASMLVALGLGAADTVAGAVARKLVLKKGRRDLLDEAEALSKLTEEERRILTPHLVRKLATLEMTESDQMLVVLLMIYAGKLLALKTLCEGDAVPTVHMPHGQGTVREVENA